MADSYLALTSALLLKYLQGSPTLKAALLTSDYVLDQSEHYSYADVSAFEIATAGDYVAGGKALTNVGVMELDSPAVGSYLTADNLTWANLNAADVGAVVFYDSSYSNILMAVDIYSAPVDASGGVAFTHTMSATGFVQIAA